MTPEEIERLCNKIIYDYMKNVDNLHLLENYLTNQKSFLEQIANSLIKNGSFVEQLSQDLANSISPIINNSIEQHEKDCGLKAKVNEVNEDKKYFTKTFTSWVWEIFKYLIQIIIILVGLLLATDGFKKDTNQNPNSTNVINTKK